MEATNEATAVAGRVRFGAEKTSALRRGSEKGRRAKTTGQQEETDAPETIIQTIETTCGHRIIDTG